MTHCLTRTGETLSGLKQRFEKDRFLRRLAAERERNEKNRQQLKTRFFSAFKMKLMLLTNIKGRLKQERVLQRIALARTSLNDKMATLKAIDPQTVLKRGFALVYSQQGTLVRSIADVAEKQLIQTRLADGSLISEVTAKEINHE